MFKLPISCSNFINELVMVIHTWHIHVTWNICIAIALSVNKIDFWKQLLRCLKLAHYINYSYLSEWNNMLWWKGFKMRKKMLKITSEKWVVVRLLFKYLNILQYTFKHKWHEYICIPLNIYFVNFILTQSNTKCYFN